VKKRLRHLPSSLLAAAVLVLVGVPAGGLAGGWAAAAGVFAGVALVAFSYVVSSVVVAWVDMVSRPMLLPVVLGTYALKFAVFGVVMWRVAEAGWQGLPAMGVAVIVATIVWTGTQLWWTLRAKIPYVEIES
jgi:hypothetical protein